MNPTSDNFFVYKLIELLGDLLKSLFVPKEETLQNLINTVKAPFSFVDIIKDGISDFINIINGVSSAPSISVDIPETKFTEQTSFVIDFSWYSPYKNYIDTIITVFIYISFFWRIFVNLPHIISGNNNVNSFEE